MKMENDLEGKKGKPKVRKEFKQILDVVKDHTSELTKLIFLL